MLKEKGLQLAGRSNILSLGLRFQLARKLAQCLYILHATGWVHKKWVNEISASFTTKLARETQPLTVVNRAASNPRVSSSYHRSRAMAASLRELD